MHSDAVQIYTATTKIKIKRGDVVKMRNSTQMLSLSLYNIHTPVESINRQTWSAVRSFWTLVT